MPRANALVDFIEVFALFEELGANMVDSVAT